MRYSNFDIRIERVGSRYRARGSSDQGFVDFDVPPLDGVGSSDSPRDVRPGPGRGPDGWRESGEALFRAVFREQILVAYRGALERCQANDDGLRIQWQLKEVPELDALPWESAYDPDEGQFLAFMPHLSMVRLFGTSDKISLEVVQGPIRILTVLASPHDEARLAAEEEWEKIAAELGDLQEQGQVCLERLQPGTFKALLDHLEQNSCHVLHFVAHGTFDEDAGGQILLETPAGRAEPIDEQRLATVLQHHRTIRLTVLNACHGGRSSPRDAYTGLTRRLVKLGVPAVIAMTTRIGDRPAVELSARFYRDLASGASIEAALAGARQHIFLHFKDRSWGTPILALRSSEAALLDLSHGRRVPRFMGRPAVVSAVLLFLFLFFGIWFVRPFAVEVCPSPSGLDLRFTLVEAGVNAGDARTGGPPLVIKNDFCLGVFEVTQAQWEAVLPEVENASAWPGANRPVERVSRLDAERFIAALNDRIPGDPFRLPTEVEWEYAARAESTAIFGFGDERADLERYGNCVSVSGQDGYDGTAPVGAFGANAWGLYDMHGNVWEWVASAEDEGEQGVLRGGSYDVLPEKCTASYRKLLAPGDRRKDYGVRLVREPRQ